MSMSFLSCVNRMLQQNGLIRGDTDPLVHFTDTNHASTSAIAQIAVQQEITELSSRGELPYQHTISATLATAAGTRTYALASDFIQMWGDPPFFFDSAANVQIFQYPGGEEALRTEILTYRTDAGHPRYFYFELGTGQNVSFFPVPDSVLSLAYDYSASVNVSAETDAIPLFTTDQQYAFTDMAARRFKLMFEGKIDVPVDADAVYREARARLFSLLKWKQPSTRYGCIYG